MLENTKPFTFTYEGKEYSMPAIKSIPNGVIRKTRNITDEVDKSYTIIELILGEDSETLKVLDQMSVSEFTDIITEWTQGSTLGESSGSES
jgi:hypothetical protein